MKKRLDMIAGGARSGTVQRKSKSISLWPDMCYVDGQKRRQSRNHVSGNGAKLKCRGNTLPYVSRGGSEAGKSNRNEFDVSMEGKVCMDVGASTGGFTDCMLQNGASKGIFY